MDVSPGWSANTAPQPPQRMIRNPLHKDAPLHSATPPDRRLASTNHPSLALPVTSTVGKGWIVPRDQASATAISWTAEEAAPRRLDNSAATHSLFDGLAVRRPPQALHRSAASPGPSTPLGFAGTRQYETPSLAPISYERADGVPYKPQEPGRPAAASVLSAEPPKGLNLPAMSRDPSTPLSFANSRHYACSSLVTVSCERAYRNPHEPPRYQGRPANPSGPSAVSGAGGTSLINTPPTPPSPPRRRP